MNSRLKDLNKPFGLFSLSYGSSAGFIKNRIYYRLSFDIVCKREKDKWAAKSLLRQSYS
jgi:hypothetical protein